MNVEELAATDGWSILEAGTKVCAEWELLGGKILTSIGVCLRDVSDTPPPSRLSFASDNSITMVRDCIKRILYFMPYSCNLGRA